MKEFIDPEDVVDNDITLASTTETAFLPAINGVKQHLCMFFVTNSSDTAEIVTIRDALSTDGGAVRSIISLPAKGGAVLPITRPMKQSVAGKPWTATCTTGVTSIYITAQAVRSD